MHLKTVVVLSVGIMLLFVSPVFAQDSNGEMAQIVVDTLTLLFLLIAAYVSMELYKIMKGGQLATSWGLFAGAAVIFALTKIIELGTRTGYFVASDIVLSAGYLFVALFLLLGFIKQRKTLG